MTKTVLMDGKIPVIVDCDDFDLAKLLLQERGEQHARAIVEQFALQPGYTFSRAADLVILCLRALRRGA